MVTAASEIVQNINGALLYQIIFYKITYYLPYVRWLLHFIPLTIHLSQ